MLKVYLIMQSAATMTVLQTGERNGIGQLWKKYSCCLKQYAIRCRYICSTRFAMAG